MGSCKNITPKQKKLCIGQFRDRIEIQTKTIEASDFDDPDYLEQFVTISNPYAIVETPKGFTSFDEVGVQTVVTHRFYIRFNPNVEITSENVVAFKEFWYKIIEVENIDETDTYLILNCIKKQKTVP